MAIGSFEFQTAQVRRAVGREQANVDNGTFAGDAHRDVLKLGRRGEGRSEDEQRGNEVTFYDGNGEQVWKSPRFGLPVPVSSTGWSCAGDRVGKCGAKGCCGGLIVPPPKLGAHYEKVIGRKPACPTLRDVEIVSHSTTGPFFGVGSFHASDTHPPRHRAGRRAFTPSPTSAGTPAPSSVASSTGPRL